MTQKFMEECIDIYNAFDLLNEKGYLEEKNLNAGRFHLLYTILGNMAVELKKLEELEDEDPQTAEPTKISGKWERRRNALGEEITVCSACGKLMKQGYATYCANCGAYCGGQKNVIE